MGHIVIARSSDLLKPIFIKILYIKFINKKFNILIYISCKNMLKVFIADKKETFFSLRIVKELQIINFNVCFYYQ